MDQKKKIFFMTQSIKSKIRTVPHWPKQGIMFRDITTLLKDAQGFKETIDLLYERYKDKKIDIRQELGQAI